MKRQLQRILATTDFHSSFDNAAPMLAHLDAARPDTLIVDCGDFFEGTGYYRLGAGNLERSALLDLYDVIAPGNHGWRHHFEPDLHQLTVCANAVNDSGEPLFRRAHFTEIAGRRVAVTVVIGPDAFRAIPADQRAGHHVVDPVRALRDVMAAHCHQAEDWILLSHSGFDRDLGLATNCPFVNVVFAGHCHSDRSGPITVGRTLVVKGRELGAGYAVAEPTDAGWSARAEVFRPAESPEPPRRLTQLIDELRHRLTEPLGFVAERFRNRTPDRRELLTLTAEFLRRTTNTDTVLLNETCLRSTRLGEVLCVGDLLATEPFDNDLVLARLPQGFSLTQLRDRVGPLVITPDPLPLRTDVVLTTRYLAATHLGGDRQPVGVRLGQAVRHVLIHGDT